MKAESTIRKQIQRLKRVGKTAETADERHGAFDAYHALRWVIQKTTWTPAGLAEKRVENQKGTKR